MYSRRSVIRETFWGSELRSTVHRLYRQQGFLDKVGRQTHVIKLQGYFRFIRFMFFGTVNQLDTYIKGLLADEPQIRFIVLDFSLISGVDYSGLETFSRVKRNTIAANTHLIFCGLQSMEQEIRLAGIFDDEEGEEITNTLLVHVFLSLNDALEWCENYLLSTYYVKSLPITTPIKSPGVAGSSSAGLTRYSIAAQTPRATQLDMAAESVIRGF